jgi:hypothetical protein
MLVFWLVTQREIVGTSVSEKHSASIFRTEFPVHSS